MMSLEHYAKRQHNRQLSCLLFLKCVFFVQYKICRHLVLKVCLFCILLFVLYIIVCHFMDFFGGDCIENQQVVEYVIQVK